MEIDFKGMKSGEVKDWVMSILKEDISKYDYRSILETLKTDNRKTVQTLSGVVNKYLTDREKEIYRVKTMYEFDRQFKKDIYIAGVDEVGRGPLAGPIVAAAVILKLNYEDDHDLILKIKDSKKLSEKMREELNIVIKEKALSYSIFEISNDEIDSKGIAWCNNEALRLAVMGLSIEPALVLSDGYAIKNCNIENKFIIKGDVKSASIACASIIAKVYRDNLMKDYSNTYPQYGFDKNSGYGTKDHIEAIKRYGYTKIHRTSFLKNILHMF
jgi:ribonuclease HII